MPHVSWSIKRPSGSKVKARERRIREAFTERAREEDTRVDSWIEKFRDGEDRETGEVGHKDIEIGRHMGRDGGG